MSLISDTAALAEFCHSLAGSAYITVDTEFMRERTYWARLCLVQVASAERAVAIDPLAAGIDLTPLFDVLATPDIVKVFHAARQDLEIFHQLMGKLPAPVFDTQVAAMVCGFGDQVGYETLVAKLAKARLDKSSRFTDWSLRPLSQRQIDYALGDVIHLRTIYEKLRQRMGSDGRVVWLEEEMTELTNPATYEMDPREAYRRIKSRGGSRFLAVLRELAAWREVQAKERDVPRGRVLRDEALAEIAHHVPTTREALARTRGLPHGFANGAQGAGLLEAVARGLAIPDEECPQPLERRDAGRGTAAIAELLKVVLKMKCDEHDVAQKLVASAADVEAIAAQGDQAGVHALTGWRRTVFGEDALKVRDGRLAVTVSGRRLKLTETGG